MTCFSSYAFTGKGGGTEKDPYQITNADEFFEIRNELDAYYKLMNDIDLADFIKEDNPTFGWAPIGNATTPFTGTLDGNNRSIKGLYINRPNMDNVGLFGCVAKSNIHNLSILNAEIIGNYNVGTLIGVYDISNGKSTMTISNIIIQDTKILCSKNGGALIGAVSFIDKFVLYSNILYVKGCYLHGEIIATETNAGGICGYAISGKEADKRYYREVSFQDNFVDARIISKRSAGGIFATTESVWVNKESGGSCVLYPIFRTYRNIVKGSISGNDYVGGMVGRIDRYNAHDEFGTIENNIAALDTILKESGKDIYRITHLACPNNYAFAGTVALWNKTPITLEDNDYNGISFGLKTLKKQSTYEGFGFDFSTQWTIKEGESFPYNINQSEMPEVAEFVGGSRAHISGKANGTGFVYVFIGGNLFESFVVDNEWKVDLGNIPVGTEAKVSVALDGKMPSIQVSAIAESGTINPTVKAGDANGDGVIDAADVVGIINYIIGKSSSSFNALNADVNGDGQVLVDDAVAAVELIMNAQ